MESTSIVGLGAGGHGRVIADILLRSSIYNLTTWLDQDTKLHGTEVYGVKVIGDDTMLSEIQASGINHAFIGVGSTGDTNIRRQIAAHITAIGMTLPMICDPSSTLSQSAEIESGVCIFPHAIINPNCKIGACAIVNTRATLEHDCTVGKFAHLAPSSTVGGNCKIGDGAHIGIGATIKENISIGSNAIVGAGAVVVSDVAPGTTVTGIPAKIHKH